MQRNASTNEVIGKTNYAEKDQVGKKILSLMENHSIEHEVNVWYLDFRASNYMTSKKKIFVEISLGDHSKVSA